MKKIISSVLSLMLFVTCFSCAGVNASEISAGGSRPARGETAFSPLVDSGFITALENEKFTLYYRESDANTALLNKATGFVWYSNPQQIDEASSGTKIKSQLLFRYYKNNAVETMDSYEFGIEEQNIPEYTIENNSLSIAYKVGSTGFTTDMLPAAMVKESMEKNILSKLSEEDKAVILERYTFYSAKDMDEETLKVIEINFPAIRKHDLYVFNSSTPAYIAESIYDAFVKAGYSVGDLDRYCGESGVINRYEEKPFFEAELKYSLTENGLTVELDPQKVGYSESFKPISVEILPYFGAALKGTEGYMLVPDGSGAVIETDNGKIGVNAYNKAIYEVDNITNADTSAGYIQLTSLPFFGMASGSGSFIASIDEGYEAAGISAEVSGSNTSFNKVNPYFTLFTSEMFNFSANKLDTYLKYSDKIFSGNIKINYMFTDGYSDYSELAYVYRQHLKNNGVLKYTDTVANDMNISFVGTAEITKSFLGIPYKHMASYTTLEQAEEILSKLSLKNADVRLTDFVQGGSNQKNAASLKLQKSVGKAKRIQSLYDNTETVYLSMFAQYQSNARKSDSAISISQEVAYKLQYNLINGKMETQRYAFLMSSKLLEKYSEKLAKQTEKYNIEAVNLRDIGYELNSDFREDSEQDRNDARIAAQKYMENLSKTAKISVDKGSVFSLPYADKIWDIPMESSNYLIEDYSVPFYQMVISGSVAYVAPAINEGSETVYRFLKCVEYGAQPQFTLTYNDLDGVIYYKEDYFGYNYENHIDTIKQLAVKYSTVSEAVSGNAIVRHKNFGGNTAVTEYENGVKIYVNYTENSQTAEGNLIPPNDFLIVK